MFLTTRIVRLAGSAAVVGAAAVCAPVMFEGAASAQVVRVAAGGPSAAMPGQGISKAQLERYAGLLGLTAEQKETAAALHEAYAADAHQAAKEQREAMKDAHSSDAGIDMEKFQEVMKKSAGKSAAIQNRFLEDLKSLLSPEQAERWPKVERVRRREQWMRFGGIGIVSGSSVDLTSVVEGLELPAETRAGLAETLEDYEQQLDRILQERERAAKEEAKGNDGMVVRSFNLENLQAQMDKSREEGLRIRELNQRFARQIGAMLPEEVRAKFDEAFKSRSFRQIFNESPAARKLAAAERFGDLTPEQREKLRRISEQYRNQLKPINERWASALEQAEKEGRAGGPFPMMAGANEPDPNLTAARQARRDLDKGLAKSLDETLTPEQRERLPKAREGQVTAMLGDHMIDGFDGEVVFHSIEEFDDGEGVGVRTIMVAPGGGGVTVEQERVGAPAKKEEPKR